MPVAELPGRASSPLYTWSVTGWGCVHTAAAEQTERQSQSLASIDFPHTVWGRKGVCMCLKKVLKNRWTDGRTFTRVISDCVKFSFSHPLSIVEPSATANRFKHDNGYTFIYRHAQTLCCIHTPHQGRPHIRLCSFVPTDHLLCKLCRRDPAELCTQKTRYMWHKRVDICKPLKSPQKYKGNSCINIFPLFYNLNYERYKDSNNDNIIMLNTSSSHTLRTQPGWAVISPEATAPTCSPHTYLL